jgi:hypothetical protein
VLLYRWQNSLYAVNQLVSSYNSIALAPVLNADIHQPMRVVAARRQILASLLEFKNRLDEWCGQLTKARCDCTSLHAIRKNHRRTLEQAESWRSIRNLTFHYNDVVEPPDDLLKAYKEIAAITDAEVNSVWKCMVEVGEAARDVAMSRA